MISTWLSFSYPLFRIREISNHPRMVLKQININYVLALLIFMCGVCCCLLPWLAPGRYVYPDSCQANDWANPSSPHRCRHGEIGVAPWVRCWIIRILFQLQKGIGQKQGSKG
jgi:hypothetical protein